MYTLKGRYTNALLTINEFEDGLINQVYRMINHAAFENNVVIMPDGHAGKGSCVGFTMPMGKKVAPAVIGVDIGCGMLSMNTGKDKLDISFEKLDKLIRENIPMGFEIQTTKSRPNSMEKFSFSKQFPWHEAQNTLNKFFTEFNKKFETEFLIPTVDYRFFIERYKNVKKLNMKKITNSIGTLGGGNHFVEFGRSKNTGKIWITVHSGSRNFGKVICEHHEKIAKDNLSKKRNVDLKMKIDEIIANTEDKTKISTLIKETKEELGLGSNVDLKGMEYLEGEDLKEYLIDMVIAQIYASYNRKHMMDIISGILGEIKDGERIESVHNYIDFRDFTIRKGAISSYVGEKMIIPFNMRDGILLCEGKSNAEWNYSAPHGAGRVLSRSAAKKTLDLDNFKEEMRGIYSTSVCKSTLDEAPGAYKDSKMIEKAIEPTAVILDRIVPIHNLKDKSVSISFKERREAKKKGRK